MDNGQGNEDQYGDSEEEDNPQDAVNPRFNENVPHVEAQTPFPALYSLPAFSITLRQKLASNSPFVVRNAMTSALTKVVDELEKHVENK